MNRLFWLLPILFVTAFVSADDTTKQLPKGHVYHTGRKAPKNLNRLYDESNAKHAKRLNSLPKITAPTWDCCTLGIVPPIKNQADCGSCWDFSGIGVCESAFIKAGYGKNDGTFALSEQYILDCADNGGCNGDDNTSVLIWGKATGLALTADYGPYQARAEKCKTVSKLLKLTDWGFCGSQEGVCDTQTIKNCMVQYGPIGCAIAADDAFCNNPAGEVFQGSGSRGINHDIILVGWDDSKGAWKLRNSWGERWCDKGYCWIKYGANLVGTEAVWAKVDPVPGPGPGPTPPTPPTPGNVGITLTAEQVKSVIDQSGSVVINGDMTLTELFAALQKASSKKCKSCD